MTSGFRNILFLLLPLMCWSSAWSVEEQPEAGSPLRLLSVEEGDSDPEQLSDLGLVIAGTSALLGATMLSFPDASSSSGLYPGSAFAELGLTLALTNTLTFGLKSTVARRRPYTFSPNFPRGGPHAYSARQIEDANRSFPSGHTSNTAGFLFGLATSVHTHLGPSSYKDELVVGLYSLALIGTALVGQMRVSAGYHFYSDVIAGGLIGMAAGVSVPLLNRHFSLARKNGTSRVDPARRILAGDDSFWMGVTGTGIYGYF